MGWKFPAQAWPRFQQTRHSGHRECASQSDRMWVHKRFFVGARVSLMQADPSFLVYDRGVISGRLSAVDQESFAEFRLPVQIVTRQQVLFAC